MCLRSCSSGYFRHIFSCKSCCDLLKYPRIASCRPADHDAVSARIFNDLLCRLGITDISVRKERDTITPYGLSHNGYRLVGTLTVIHLGSRPSVNADHIAARICQSLCKIRFTFIFGVKSCPGLYQSRDIPAKALQRLFAGLYDRSCPCRILHKSAS